MCSGRNTWTANGTSSASASQRFIANSEISTIANSDNAAVSHSSCCCRSTTGMPPRWPAPTLKTTGSVAISSVH